ncbi:hypothetical protein ACF1BQ_027510 [Bradyrhizobium sp. RDT10]
MASPFMVFPDPQAVTLKRTCLAQMIISLAALMSTGRPAIEGRDGDEWVSLKASANSGQSCRKGCKNLRAGLHGA